MFVRATLRSIAVICILLIAILSAGCGVCMLGMLAHKDHPTTAPTSAPADSQMHGSAHSH